MLIFDFHAIGEKLYAVRKKSGMTQAEVAELAGLSDRTYADIERGSVNMRIETVLKICRALGITPDALLTEENSSLTELRGDVMQRLDNRSLHEQETALRLMAVYLDSLK